MKSKACSTGKMEYCADADLKNTDFCVTDDGGVAQVPTDWSVKYQDGDGILTPLQYLQTWSRLPIDELRPDQVRTAMQDYFCYYNRHMCDEMLAQQWDALWKGMVGYTDAVNCGKTFTDPSAGGALSCVWTIINVAAFAIPMVRAAATVDAMIEAARAARAADAAAGMSDAARIGSAGADAADLAKVGATAMCSFRATTPVLLADGATKPISKIVPGDVILTTDPDTHEEHARTVTGVWVHNDPRVPATRRRRRPRHNSKSPVLERYRQRMGTSLTP